MFLQEFWLSPCVGTAVMHLLLIAASCVFFQILLSQGQFLQWIPQVKTLFTMWTLLEYNPAALPDFNRGRVTSGAEYQDIEVHLRRQKSGFGFRVLGGDEAGQPVSPETREKARMAMGVEPCHFLLSNPLHTHCVHLTPDL